MSPKHTVRASSETGVEDPLRAAATRWVFTFLRHTREEARRAGMTLPQRLVLGTLRRAGPVPVSRLTEWTGASPAAMSGILDGLDGQGLLTRRHGTEDRRTVLVSLSSLGQRRAGRFDARDRARWAPLLRSTSPPDAEIATRVLGRLSEGFTGSGRPRRGPTAPGRSAGRSRPGARRARGAGAA